MQLSKSYFLVAMCISAILASNAFALPRTNIAKSSPLAVNTPNEYFFHDEDWPVSDHVPSHPARPLTTILLTDGLFKLPTLRQRRGNRSIQVIDEVQTLHATWVRVENTSLKYGANGTTAVQFESNRTQIQAGIDFYGHKNSFGKWVFGITSQYGMTDSTFNDIPQDESMESHTFGIGGTATLYDDQGAYVDWQFQYNRVFEVTDFIVSRLRFVGMESSSYAAGVEFGRPYQRSETISIVPQGQIRWISTFRDKSNYGFAVDSIREQIDGISVRAGMAIEYKGESMDAYFLNSYFYDTTRFWKLQYLQRTYNVASGPMSYEYAIGGQIIIGNKLTLYLDSSYRGDFEDNSDLETKVMRLEIGLRRKW